VFWFVQRAVEHDVRFLEPIPQQICALRRRPIYPKVGGAARIVNTADVDLFGQWLTAFLMEAAPHDPLPTREGVEKTAAAGNYRFWIMDREPVAMAGIVRRTRRGAAIAGVYTPPALRNRGYAAAVTGRDGRQRLRRRHDHGVPLFRSAQYSFKPLLRQDRL
jgi:predicted GNAT family acetyltransferase